MDLIENLKIIGRTCLFMKSGLGAHFNGFTKFQHRHEHRNNIPGRFGYRPTPFHMSQHFNTSICMFSKLLKVASLGFCPQLSQRSFHFCFYRFRPNRTIVWNKCGKISGTSKIEKYLCIPTRGLVIPDSFRPDDSLSATR